METPGRVQANLPFPEEVLDEIFTEVDLHADLIRLASSCRLFHTIAIPRHTEYRVIQIPLKEDYQYMFAHLVQRPDLTSFIREIHLLSYPTKNEVRRLHLPTSFVQEDKDKRYTLDETKFNMVHAIRAMKRLQAVKFDWTPDYLKPYRTSHMKSLVPALLEILQDVGYVQPQSFYDTHPFLGGQPIKHFGLWNLKSLTLSGNRWIREYQQWRVDPSRSKSVFCDWLQNLSHLETLSLPGCILLEHIESLCFLNLKSLSFRTHQLDDTHIRQIMIFLQRHSTITALTWDSNGELRVPYYFLPNLTQLVCKPELLVALMRTYKRNQSLNPRPLPIETLVILPGDLTSVTRKILSRICDVPFIDWNSLRRLSVHHIEYTEELPKLSRRFPFIQELSFPQSEVITCDCLQLFPNLEVLHGLAIWYDYKIHIEESRRSNKKPRKSLRTKIIQGLATACPKLRQVDHPIEKTQKIVIAREGKGGIRCQVVNRRPKDVFDIIPRFAGDSL